MSCDWDICCVECGEELGISDANHKLETMRSIIANRSAMEALAEAAESADAVAGLDIDLRVDYVSLPDMGFFLRHKGHRLAPRSEYGTIDGRCNERLKCGVCETQHICKLDTGHRGECSFKEPTAP